MVNVSRARLPVSGLFAFLMFSVLTSSCGDKNSDGKKDSSITSPTTVEIPPPPFTVELAPNYEIVPEMTMVGVNYYFQTEDPAHANDAGGIYFGALPDTSSPPTDYIKREYMDIFMGDSVVWREFKTAKYTHREVFIHSGENEKTHAWCYAHDSVTLENLTTMIKSIRKK
jgi:hypothetical protein